jgi:hypothetical protein
MRHTRNEEILSAAYDVRIEAIEALREAARGGEATAARLYAASTSLKAVAERYGDAPSAAIYLAFSELAHMVGLLTDWRLAVLNAGNDAQRFQTAAKERAQGWLERHQADGSLAGLHEFATGIAGLQSVIDVAKAAAQLASLPLPIGIFSIPKPPNRDVESTEEAQCKPEQLAVAFLKFTIDGIPLSEIHYVSPGEMHDLDIEVRVSRWPQGATALILQPVTIEQSGVYKMPVFSIPAPAGAGPFRLTERGRAMLSIPNHLNARQFEFKYAASFEPRGTEQPVEVVGQRTLLLEGVDLARHPLTGYANLDRKLFEIRDSLRPTPGLPHQEAADALALLTPLANFAGQVVQDNLFKAATTEAEFQERLRLFLRSQPNIGSQLEEHPRSTGGITDLSYKGIRLELKSEPHKRLTLADCQQFVGQAASYAVGNGKRLGVLCVLDCSAKTQPAFPVQDGIGVFTHQQGETAVFVLTVLLQGHLALPSSFSR